ncbi:NAD(P)/FAD-dependent oxidoreductase [Nocardia nova]|uniref:FAD-dependent oxidoreductase n=1 Tax=Nocardia nova TaxID=37330 RepID=A0A2S6A1V4_9NOCA|nr:FAD-dependent oxidoreductase [Nocardia nova]PPJ25553.1 FAD-dependent oxidoreductase [Nocardia nova]
MAEQGLVIVGASLAGLRAVETARSSGFTGPITLIGAEDHLPYDRPPLSKEFLAVGEPPDTRFCEENALREELGVDLRLGTGATGLDTADRVVHVGDVSVPYSALVIATGAAARTLPIDPRLAGVHTLRTLDDAAAVRAALDAGARTVVVGAGFIGSEVASAARRRGLPVTIVEAAPVPLTRSVGTRMGGLLGDLHRKHGVDLKLGAGVDLVKGEDTVEAVVLADGTTLPTDLVVVGVGAAPATQWLAGAVDLDERDGGVVCDRTLRTTAPGVYAAGDVCRWDSALFERPLRLEHWTSAAEQGATAARNALDPAAAADYDTVPYFWSDWYDHRIQFVGDTHDSEVEVIDRAWDEDKLLALYRRGDIVVGALTVNRPSLIMKFRRMIAGRTAWDEAVEFGRART